jgi:hypothetical protein
MKKLFLFTAIVASAFAMQAQSILNSDFELWSYGRPVNWTTDIHGSIVSSSMSIPVEVHFGQQSSVAHTGNSAVRITSADASSTAVGFTMNLPGVLQAGESDGFQLPMDAALTILDIMQGPDGIGSILSNLDSLDLNLVASFLKIFSKGVPCETTPYSVSAWVKYIPQEGDKMAMFALTKKNGVPVDYTYQVFEAIDTTEYNQVGISLNSPTAECDSIMVVLVSTTMMNSSSVLYVDDVELHFTPDGIADKNQFPGSIYPNPASDLFYLHPNSDQPYTWTLLDLTGKTLQTGEAVGRTSINTKDYPTGLYLLHINGEGISGTRKVMIR